MPVPRSFSLAQKEANIAITVDQPMQGLIVARKLINYTLGLYAHEAYLEKHGTPQNNKELKRHRLIGYIKDIVASPALAYTDKISNNWAANLQVSSADGQIEVVRSQEGIGILHHFLANSIKELKPILPHLII